MRFGPPPPRVANSGAAASSTKANTARGRRLAEDDVVAAAPPVVDFESDAINLRGVGVDAVMCRELCAALRVNESVRHLDLSHNEIGDSGAEELCSLLSGNPTLTALNASHNQLSDWGATCIARGNRRHGALQSINLAGNPLGDAGLADLGRMLQHSEQLRELVLTDTNVTFNGAVTFIEMALRNYSLLYLALPFSLGFKLLEEVDKLLRRNWARANQIDRKLQMAEVLLQRLQQQEETRRRQWERTQAAAEPPMSRTRTVQAPMADWRDAHVGPSLLALSLLDRKARHAEEERAERDELRSAQREASGLPPTPRSGRSSVASLPPLPNVPQRAQQVSRYPAITAAMGSPRSLHVK